MTLEKTRQQFSHAEISKPQFIELMHQYHAILFEYAGYIGQTDIAKIEITDNTVIMTSRGNGTKIVCDKDDKRIAPIEILNFDHYEKADSDMIFRLLKDHDTIFDIGANIGWYSINIGKQFHNAKILSFEPIPKTFKQLQRNVDLNAVPNVKINNFGFSSKEEDLTFYYYPEGSGNASAANLTDSSGVEKIVCKVTTLDKFFSENGTAIDFIKCDVEGAELFVFQGGHDTISKHKPIVFTEILRKWSAKFHYNPNEIIQLFTSLGYRCFIARDSKLVEFYTMDEDTIETNFFFLHAEKHAREIIRLS